MSEDLCIRWRGPAMQYQSEARRAYAEERGGPMIPWSLVTTKCQTPQCLSVDCMTLHAPLKIRYPVGVCTYCGCPAGTQDHLLPRAWSGDTTRRQVAVVPACSDCNVRVGTAGTYNVTERRAIAHAKIRRRFKNLLERPTVTEADLMDLGPGLRSVALLNNEKTEWVRARLAWPEDVEYDLRAFQRSGIEDPFELGLCDPLPVLASSA